MSTIISRICSLVARGFVYIWTIFLASTILITNAEGSVPGKVTGVRAVSSSTKIAIKWNVPKTSSPITKYIIIYKVYDESGYNSLPERDITDNRAIISGVSPGKSYNIRIAAVNKNGIGAFSDTYSIATKGVSQNTTLKKPSSQSARVPSSTNDSINSCSSCNVSSQQASITPTASKTLANITLLSSTTGIQPFTFGQAFKKGDIPSGSFVSIENGTSFEVVAKNRWPDGSLKYGIISGTADFVAGTEKKISLLQTNIAPISASLLTTRDLETANPRVLISFGTIGSVNWSGNDWNNPFLTWIQGSQMSSWIYRKPIGSDGHLVAWLEVRLYQGGKVEILPWIENGYLLVTGPTSKSGQAKFILNDREYFSEDITLANHTRTPLINGSALSYWMDGPRDITILLDRAYLQETGMVPKYGVEVPSNATILSQLPNTYKPFQQGSYPTSMGTAGYHGSIGIIPEWDVLYLTSSAKTIWSAIQRNAYSAGRYGIYFRDEGTNMPIRFSKYPYLSLGGGSGISGIGGSSKGQLTPPATGTIPPTYTNSHAPSLGYLAYIVTGRYYHLETVQFQATIHFLKNGDINRQYSSGILLTEAGSNTTRGAAWALRTLAQALNITPEDSPLYEEFRRSLSSNIDYYYTRYVLQPNNPFGFVRPYSDYTGVGDGQYFEATWMQDFFTAAVGMMKSFDLSLDSTIARKLSLFFEWKAQSVVGRFGGTSTDEYLYRDAAQYTITVAPSDTPDFITGKGPWHPHWGNIYTKTVSPSVGTRTEGDLRGAYFPDATSYWGNLQPALSYAVEHGVPGAQVAYTRMTGASNWPQFLESAKAAPTWSVVPRSITIIPPNATYRWKEETWSACSVTCGGGTQTRKVVCIDTQGITVDDTYCANIPKPPTTQACNTQSCTIRINGSCGSAHGGSFNTPPQTYLCSAGSATTVTTSGSFFTWMCQGSGGGTTASCSAKNTSSNNIPPPSKSGGLLRTISASLTPGNWAILNQDGDTSGYNRDLLIACSLPNNGGSCSDTIVNYADKGLWDPISEKIHFLGAGHLTAWKFITYDVSTNTWMRQPKPFFDCRENPNDICWGMGHGYEHSTINPNNGDVYWRLSNSTNMYRWVKSSGQWSVLPSAPNPAIAVSTTYFPDLGGILLVGGGQVHFFDESQNKWSIISSSTPMGPYHNIATYDPIHKVIIFGGGNDSKKLYKFDTNRKITPIADAPEVVGINASVFTVDPVSGNFLLFTKTGNFYEYQGDKNVWLKLSSENIPFWNSQENKTLFRIAVPITNYGVIVFLGYNPRTVWVYKHSSTGYVPIILHGSCGQSHGKPTNTIPTTGLCSSGIPSSVSANQISYIWTCAGTNGGTTANCMAPRSTNASYTYSWNATSWSSCSVTCGGGIQTRTISCARNDGVSVADYYCQSSPKPNTSQSCNTHACGGTNPSNMPSWVTSLPLWTWYAIPNTALSSVEPKIRPLGSTGPISKIVAWNGATLKRKGSIYLIGNAGGHADYVGNEVDALALNTENPHWVELKGPTPNDKIINTPAQFYLDLRPSSTHTYYATQFIDQRDRMFVMPSPGINGSSFPTMPTNWAYTGGLRTSSFNLVTNDWDSPDYVSLYLGGGDFTAGLTVKHPVTGDVYMARVGSNWWRWNQSSNTWTNLGSNGGYDTNYAGAAIDPIRNRILVVGSYDGAQDPRMFDLSGKKLSVNFTGLGASSLRMSGYPGVIYDEVNDDFIVAKNNAGSIKIFRIDAETLKVEEPTIVGNLPTSRQNGIHNSIQYVPELGGIVIANSYIGNVYFMRTSLTPSTR